MLEFVDSDLYFVQDKNNFINQLLQVGKKYRIRRAKNHQIRPDSDPHPCRKVVILRKEKLTLDSRTKKSALTTRG